MKLYRSLTTVTMAVLGVFLLSQAATAVTWDDVKKKARSGNFQVLYKFEGDRGDFEFKQQYAGDKIRTEILKSKSDPSRRGTVVYYDKSWKADAIRAKIGGGVIVRKLSHDDVEDTAFYRSIFDLIFTDTDACGEPEASKQGSKTRFSFRCPGGYYKVWVNEKAEIIKSEENTDRYKQSRRFFGYEWGVDAPKIDL